MEQLKVSHLLTASEARDVPGSPWGWGTPHSALIPPTCHVSPEGVRPRAPGRGAHLCYPGACLHTEACALFERESLSDS